MLSIAGAATRARRLRVRAVTLAATPTGSQAHCGIFSTDEFLWITRTPRNTIHTPSAQMRRKRGPHPTQNRGRSTSTPRVANDRFPRALRVAPPRLGFVPCHLRTRVDTAAIHDLDSSTL